MEPGTSAVSQSLAIISPASLSLGSALGSKEDKQTLGVSLRWLEEQIGQQKSLPWGTTVQFQFFASQGSQDPRLPTKPTGHPASAGDSQEPEGQDALPF